ncbi:JmjC domain-containing protein [Pantanalinema rosaneae CENA516]|uniref:JmjC domain-containing protein n=1 Tax=Pantanalinema rosaneae TaxID=1620701 RepID=UPI003D6F33F3
METLKGILAPYSLERFLTQDWAHQAIHIPDATRKKFQTLFSWKDLNYLLNFHRLGDPHLRFSQDGQALLQPDRSQWRDCLQQGATLIINSVDELVPSVSELAKAVYHELGYSGQVNLYASPAQQQGFDTHFDTHDVLILQIEGDKEWVVFRDTIPDPLVYNSSEHLPPDEPPYLQCRLQPGDVLYIPRGHWHYAIAGQLPSLHLTLGINCQTGIDWLAWLVSELQDDPLWRQNLPLVCQGDPQALEEQLEKLRHHLYETLQQSSFRQRYYDHLSQQIQPITPFSFPAQLGLDIFPNAMETRFIRPKFQTMQITTLGVAHHQVTIGTKQVTLKGLPDDLIPKLFQPNGFNLMELADWAPDLDLKADVIPLLTELVTTGVLLVAD